METSQIALNQGLTFLAVATGAIFVLIGAFLVKFLIDLAKLTRNIDDTTTMVKTELEPTIQEVNKALVNINSITQNADKQLSTLSNAIEKFLGAGSFALVKAKKISTGLIKGMMKGFFAVFKMFKK